MKLRNVFCSVMAAAMAFVACDQEADLGAPDITLSTNEIVLPSEAGDTTITVKATLDWTVNVDETVEWLAIDPMGGNASNDDQTVTLSYFANDGYDREVSVAFTIGLKTKYLTVTQKGAQGSADALVIYANDFDKEEAVEIEGKGWPYLDNSEVWKNATGTGAENVTYASSGVTVRNNSNSDGKYSDYSGSGMNNIFFGKSPYFAVHGIALGEAVNFNITFGTEKYSKDNGSIFTNSEFHIWLSADGTKWVELTDYVFAGGETEGRWNVASANFSVPAGTSTLSLCFAVDVASSYRVDDLKLTVAAKEGTKIDFTSAVEKNFGSGSTGGSDNGGSDNGGNNGGGEVTPPADAILFESFTSGIGSFTTDDKVVPSGMSAVWEYSADYTCMKASGYVNATKENLAAEGWLISPEIDLAAYTTVFFTFEHAGGYFGTAANEATVWISKDGGEWINLPIEASAYPTSWDFKSAGVWDLAAYAGSKVKIAFKYLSTTTKAGTWELRNVSVTASAPVIEEDGSEDVGEDTGGGSATGDGNYNSTISWTCNTGAYDANTSTKQSGTFNGTSVSNLLKLGKSDATGSAVLKIPAGTKKIGFYAVGWKGSTDAKLKFSNGAIVSVKANEGATGNPPYTITLSDSNDYYFVEVNAESDLNLTVENVSKRVIIVGLKAIE